MAYNDFQNNSNQFYQLSYQIKSFVKSILSILLSVQITIRLINLTIQNKKFDQFHHKHSLLIQNSSLTDQIRTLPNQMQPSFSKLPSISTFVQEQRKYSAQQLSKIQQSNHKLDQLEQKMKSLLEKDKNRKKSNFLAPRDFSQQQPNSDQVNRYFESSKKYPHEYDFAHDIDNEDLLLDNHGYQQQERKMKNTRHFSIHQRQTTNTHSNHMQRSQQHITKREKSTGSLKIFKRPTNKSQENAKFSIGNPMNQEQQNSKFKSKNSKSISFGNQQADKNSRQMSNFSSLNMEKQQNKRNELQSMVAASMANMVHPHSDIHQINQLELMMQKSLQIKQKQLLLAEEELKATEEAKIIEYRKNMDLEIHLENVKKYRNEISLMTKGSHPIKLPHTDPEMQILCEEVIKEKTQFQRINESLLKELRQLEDQEYGLKLQKKKVNFELNSLQREFQKILKHHAKRMKENVAQNHQKSLNQQESAQRILPKRYPSTKKFKTHKKHSSSTIQPRQSTQQKYENYLQPQSLKTRRNSRPCLSKSKQKDQIIHTNQATSANRPKISKSISCSGINTKNRHALSGCQAQYKNCGTDKVLIDMVHELDKLKDIVNKEIVKTRAKKSQRRVIELIR